MNRTEVKYEQKQRNICQSSREKTDEKMTDEQGLSFRAIRVVYRHAVSKCQTAV